MRKTVHEDAAEAKRRAVEVAKERLKESEQRHQRERERFGDSPPPLEPAGGP